MAQMWLYVVLVYFKIIILLHMILALALGVFVRNMLKRMATFDNYVTMKIREEDYMSHDIRQECKMLKTCYTSRQNVDSRVL